MFTSIEELFMTHFGVSRQEMEELSAANPARPPPPVRKYNQEVWEVVDNARGNSWVGQEVHFKGRHKVINGRLVKNVANAYEGDYWAKNKLTVAWHTGHHNMSTYFCNKKVFLGWHHYPSPPNKRQQKRIAKWKAKCLKALKLSERARLLIVLNQKLGKGRGGRGFFKYVCDFI